MSKVVAFANNKGGVGKTTTVAVIAQAWSMKGYKVLLMDLDPQANLTSILAPIPPSDDVNTLKDAIAYRTSVPIISIAENIDLIPSSLSLSSLENEVAGQLGREFLVADLLGRLKDNYDVVIIDCPPTLGYLVINAFMAADHLVLVSTPDKLGFEGMNMTIESAEHIKENPRMNQGLLLTGLIITKYKRSNLANTFLSVIKKTFSSLVIATPVREATKVQQATTFNKNLFLYDPEGKATMDYKAVADELEQRVFGSKEKE